MKWDRRAAIACRLYSVARPEQALNSQAPLAEVLPDINSVMKSARTGLSALWSDVVAVMLPGIVEMFDGQSQIQPAAPGFSQRIVGVPAFLLYHRGKAAPYL